jgi:hypothetical protein
MTLSHAGINQYLTIAVQSKVYKHLMTVKFIASFMLLLVFLLLIIKCARLKMKEETSPRQHCDDCPGTDGCTSSYVRVKRGDEIGGIWAE